ncbi:hypothetical protein [Acinetobacter sp. ANC5681]|uniref:hypothetical protein n=1 Tax=Acinetobacter sp. ANC5681 TaxID=2929504 RepID=UPI00201ABEC7|nr:hypothetical protein [Acinetobacter sp. ANC5681]MCL5767237.1 hypothetical protein [Acinetobacter sp. ANC5681]
MTRFMLSMLILMSLNSATQANFFKFQTLAKVESLKNIAYGHDSQQMMDIYFPSKPHTDNNLAPIIVMVHGGAWSIGDKNNAAVVKNKVMCAELAGDFHLGDSRQLTDKSLLPFDLVS